MVRVSVVLVGFLTSMVLPGVHVQDVLSTIGITTIPLLVAHSNARIPGVPASFTTAERWSYYLHRTYHPQRLGILALETGLDHALRQPALLGPQPHLLPHSVLTRA